MPSDLFNNGIKVIPDAFHGTRTSLVSKILVEGFKIDRNDRHHLGFGVYFYESSFRSAKSWAEKVKKYPDPAVIKSRIDSTRCLDFFDKEVQNMIGQLVKEFAKKKRPHTFASVVEFMANQLNYDMVRAVQVSPDSRSMAYLPGDSVYENYPCSQVILCVRDVVCITHSEQCYPKT